VQRLRELVAKGANLESTNGDPWYHTPLHQACYHGRPLMVAALLELGAYKSCADLPSNPMTYEGTGRPIELARGGEHAEVVRLLEQYNGGSSEAVPMDGASSDLALVFNASWYVQAEARASAAASSQTPSASPTTTLAMAPQADELLANFSTASGHDSVEWGFEPLMEHLRATKPESRRLQLMEDCMAKVALAEANQPTASLSKIAKLGNMLAVWRVSTPKDADVLTIGCDEQGRSIVLRIVDPDFALDSAPVYSVARDFDAPLARFSLTASLGLERGTECELVVLEELVPSSGQPCQAPLGTTCLHAEHASNGKGDWHLVVRMVPPVVDRPAPPPLADSLLQHLREHCPASATLEEGHGYALVREDCQTAFAMIPAKSIDLICIDPPYGDNYERKGGEPYKDEGFTPVQWRALINDGWRVLKPGGRQLIFCSARLFKKLLPILQSEPSVLGYTWHSWQRSINDRPENDRRNTYLNEQGEYMFCVYTSGVRKHSLYERPEDHRDSEYLGEFRHRPTGESVKPKALYERVLLPYSQKKGKSLVVLDYCMYSGLCGEVALELGHRFIGVEIMQGRFNDAKARLAALTLTPAPVLAAEPGVSSMDVDDELAAEPGASSMDVDDDDAGAAEVSEPGSSRIILSELQVGQWIDGPLYKGKLIKRIPYVSGLQNLPHLFQVQWQDGSRDGSVRDEDLNRLQFELCAEPLPPDTAASPPSDVGFRLFELTQSTSSTRGGGNGEFADKYTKICELLQETVPNAQQIRVWRIDNPILRAQFGDTLGNIEQLWHSTNIYDEWGKAKCLDPIEVCKTGFPDGEECGNYGRGVYFAKHALYCAFVMAPPPTVPINGKVVKADGFLVLADVALGRCFDCDTVTDCKVTKWTCSLPAGLPEEEGLSEEWASWMGTEGEGRQEWIEKPTQANPKGRDTGLYGRIKEACKRGVGNEMEDAKEMRRDGEKYAKQYVVREAAQAYPSYLVSYQRHGEAGHKQTPPRRKSGGGEGDGGDADGGENGGGDAGGGESGGAGAGGDNAAACHDGGDGSSAVA